MTCALLPPADRPARRMIVGCLACALLCCGCVQRRMTIRTNPPGAQCYIDDYEIGTTPCATDFVYYGTRKIRLVKDGYETLTIEQTIRPPWFEWFPLDFVTENLYPGEIRDEQAFNYQLTPQRIMPSVEILQRAENLRRASHLEGFNQPNDMVAAPAPTRPGAPAGSRPLPRPPGVPGYMTPGFVPGRDDAPPGSYSPLPGNPLGGPGAAIPVDPFSRRAVPPTVNAAPVTAPPLLPPAFTAPPQGSAMPVYDPPGAR